MGSEELYIIKIEAGIRAIKMGTKTPEEAKVGFALNRLKDSNLGMYEDLMNNYKAVLKEYHEKNPK